MTKTVLVVLSSMRPNSAGKGFLSKVIEKIAARQVEVKVVDLHELQLPFFNSEIHPAQPNYVISNDRVRLWQKAVDEADAVVMFTPEYNHQIVPSQSNAIDWLYADWQNKRVGILNYGFRGAPHSAKLVKEMLSFVKAKPVETTTNLAFSEGHIADDGVVLNEALFDERIDKLIEDLLGA